jgi:hypothetical protein
MIQGKSSFFFYSFVLIFCSLRLSCFARFKGELYGVGSNHTKYKTNKYSSSTNNGNNNGNNNSNSGGQLGGGMIMSQHPQLQFSSAVHYPTNLQMNNLTNSPAPSSFGYEEGY